MITLTLAAGIPLSGLLGCSAANTRASPTAYGREGPAIGLARERSASAERQREAERQQRELDRPARDRSPATSNDAIPTPPAAGAVKHVLIVWLKSPGDKAARQKVIDSAAALRGIPGVVGIEAGDCLPSDRAVVDSTYDVAVITTFASEQALTAYGPHPVHRQVVRDVIEPNVARYVVYDFVSR